MSLEELSRDAPFSYRALKSGAVEIACDGRPVTMLSARDAARFLANVEATDEAGAQLVMAKATGHFKHGTERAGKNRRGRRL